jgi:glyoxylase-like metal-dependent hydrolase (beta-lactamase superfamily II)/rhodanese-related sulfurtransferase
MTDDFPEPVEEVGKVKPDNLREKINEDEEFLLLDVRAENEHQEWSIEPGKGEIINVPYFNLLDGLTEELKQKLVDEEREIIVVCAKGSSSEYIASLIKEELGKDARNLAEGMNGWASIYESSKMNIENGELIQYHRPSSGCLGYMVKSQGEAAVIDPLRAFTERYVEDAGESELKYAIDTHIHADHISGVRELGEQTEATPVIPEATRGRDVKYIDQVQTVEDGETLKVGEIEIKALHTPGHTTGMTSYLVDKEAVLTGDGLFIGSVARPDLEKGDEGAEKQAEQLYNSIHEKILTLPEDTYIGAAHLSDGAEPGKNGLYMKKIGEIRKQLAPLSYGKNEFVEYIISDMPPRPANYDKIIPTNKGEREASDEEAFEMELGPNNCAATKESMT